MAKKNFIIATTFFILTFAASAHAVSLAGRTTDDSVCDLSPLTSYRLSMKNLIVAGTQNLDQIYERLSLRFITRNCKNNQTLILDSDDGNQLDLRYFRNISNRLCTISGIERVANGTAENPNGFQIKCKIVKLDEATKWLKEAEAVKTTENLVTESEPRNSASSSSGSSGASTSTREDCNKLTYTSIFIGGGGCR